MIKVENLCKAYGSKLAVDNVSFSVGKGEILGFIGPNGAGKTTTMRIIAGFIPMSSGKVTVGGHDVESDPVGAKSLIGYLPENAPLYSTMTVGAFLNFAAEMRGFSGAEKRRRIEQAVKSCFLSGVLNQKAETLSKGYRRRACLAQAIIHDPEVMILDEPTDGLDPNQKREIRGLIKSMSASKVIILSTHILEEVDAICSRTLIIDKGKLVFDGSADQLRAKAEKTLFTLDLGGVSAADAIEKLKKIEGVEKIEDFGAASGKAALKIAVSKSMSADVARHAIFELVKSQSWDLVRFSRDEGRLDEVFYSITSKDAA
jgi:ABC-2 type transport system ATP-binding protein